MIPPVRDNRDYDLEEQAMEASEHGERATRTERADEAARERACGGVRGAKPLGPILESREGVAS